MAEFHVYAFIEMTGQRRIKINNCIEYSGISEPYEPSFYIPSH